MESTDNNQTTFIPAVEYTNTNQFECIKSIVVEGNRRFKEKMNSTDPEYFKTHMNHRDPHTLCIACIDTRLTINKLLGTEAGQVFCHRNPGAQCLLSDSSLNASIQLTMEMGVDNILVLGHTDCAAAFRSVNEKHEGPVSDWMNELHKVYAKHQTELEPLYNTDRKLFIRTYSEIIVREQVERLVKHECVQNAWKDRKAIKIHGFVYEVENGNLNHIVSKYNSLIEEKKEN